MGILLYIVLAAIALWAVVALAMALAPYVFGIATFLVALWAVVWAVTAVIALIAGMFAKGGK